MELSAIPAVLEQQRRFFKKGDTRDLDFRIQQLKKLRQLLISNEERILKALQIDLSKPAFEAYGGEIGVLIQELNHTIRHVRSWASPKIVPTPISLFPSQSRIHYEPRGVVLIVGPWNYPFQLLLAPLIGAMAAGNCAVIKPSELAAASSELIAALIGQEFPKEYVAVVEGGKEVAEELLRGRFDYIFFTGGTAVGKAVARVAAENLTPVTLELGGKSPCIVDEDVDFDVTARRIVWGKFYNAGQSCVAPDYLLVHRSANQKLIAKMKEFIRHFFGDDPSGSPDYARIINERHFDRLSKLLEQGKIIFGGKQIRSQLYIEPALMEEVRMNGEIMTEEIFGPILPVIPFQNLEEAIAIVDERPNPLSLYVFSNNRNHRRVLVEQIPFGGGCINNTLVHLTNPNLPFGGVGSSGVGSYHGRYSFVTFSHRKGLVHSSVRLDSGIRYQPYGNKLRFLRHLMK